MLKGDPHLLIDAPAVEGGAQAPVYAELEKLNLDLEDAFDQFVIGEEIEEDALDLDAVGSCLTVDTVKLLFLLDNN